MNILMKRYRPPGRAIACPTLPSPISTNPTEKRPPNPPTQSPPGNPQVPIAHQNYIRTASHSTSTQLEASTGGIAMVLIMTCQRRTTRKTTQLLQAQPQTVIHIYPVLTQQILHQPHTGWRQDDPLQTLILWKVQMKGIFHLTITGPDLVTMVTTSQNQEVLKNSTKMSVIFLNKMIQGFK